MYTYNGILFSFRIFRRKFATAWVNLEDIMGSEIRQSQKENTTLFHWYEVLIITKLTEQRMQ